MNNKIKISVKRIKDWQSEEIFGYSFSLPQYEVVAKYNGKNYFHTFVGFDECDAKNEMQSLILSNKINPKND